MPASDRHRDSFRPSSPSRPNAMARKESHKIQRIGWLRAAVLGANDGILSTASLMLGVAGAHATRSSILVAGVAGLVAGSMSMAAGEYVSVSSQADSERAALDEESSELSRDEAGEERELAAIYVKRGLDLALARQVAAELTRHDALAAHARDELGISEIATARPLQAAGASALSFAAGSALPLAVAAASPLTAMSFAVAVAALVALVALGGVAARSGGAPFGPAIARVTFWGSAAMAGTYAIGSLFGVGPL